MKVDKLISNSQPKNWFDTITRECSAYPIYKFITLYENSIVVDCGCNVGGFVNAFGKFCKNWICIDASSYNIESFSKNFPNFNGKLLHKAVSNNDGEVVKLMKYTDQDLNDTPSGNFGIIEYVSSLNNHGWKPNEYEEVTTISIEEVIKLAGGKIDLLKVDVEGSEYNFLFKKDLSNINYIVMELHNFLGDKKKSLCEWIEKTHTQIHTDGDGDKSHFVKIWKIK